jgi:hypothetical protein
MRIKTKKTQFDFDEEDGANNVAVENGTVINSGLDHEGESQKVLHFPHICYKRYAN